MAWPRAGAVQFEEITRCPLEVQDYVHQDGTAAQQALAATGRTSNRRVTRIGDLPSEPNRWRWTRLQPGTVHRPPRRHEHTIAADLTDCQASTPAGREVVEVRGRDGGPPPPPATSARAECYQWSWPSQWS
ncbi:hypothetical protein AB0D08_29735 [Kitasatospora sp. NPDC048540]|uniref:hypothetical protein n=1 Tax=Kitasatospora sp. NPDC048540 TaxID=3155634 RepID=UPI0034046CBB